MGILGQNLRFAVRQLWRNPGFTGTVILTLALSIGANTAIFCVVNTLLLNSLPDAECFCYARGDATIQTRYASFRVCRIVFYDQPKGGTMQPIARRHAAGGLALRGTSGPYCPA